MKVVTKKLPLKTQSTRLMLPNKKKLAGERANKNRVSKPAGGFQALVKKSRKP